MPFFGLQPTFSLHSCTVHAVLSVDVDYSAELLLNQEFYKSFIRRQHQFRRNYRIRCQFRYRFRCFASFGVHPLPKAC